MNKRHLKRASPLLLCAVILLASIFLSTVVSALSPEQRRLMQGGILYYNIDECAGVGAGSTNSGSASGKVYMLGDSITQGTEPALRSALTNSGFSEVIIDGVASRRLSPGSDALDGVGVLERSTDQIKDANTVIIALGTNGGVTAANIETSMNVIKTAAPGAKVYWVNIGVDNGKRGTALDADGTNATLQQNSNKGYAIIDWASQVTAHPEYIADDGLGVHPSEAGKGPFASTVATGAVAGGLVPAKTANPNCACNANGSSVTLVGADNAEKIYNFFVGKGLQPFQAAGILGNMQAESAIEPLRLEGTNPGVETPAEQVPDKNAIRGWGLVQWTPAAKIIDPVQAEGKDPNDLGVQLEFLWAQLEGQGPAPEKAAGDEFKATTTIEDATTVFTLKYERPAVYGRKLDMRIGFAREWLAKFGSNTGGVASGSKSNCGGGGNGQVVGGFSLPLDRKWFDENPTWLTKPHHTYPAADLPVPVGTPIYSMTAGKVITAPTSGSCGIGLVIEAAPGILFTYCHGTDGGAVDGARAGDTVQPGQLIMHSGNTGRSTGPHLHISIDVNGNRLCPQGLLEGIFNSSPPTVESLPDSGCVSGTL